MNDQSNTPVMPAAPESFFQVWIKAVTRPSEQTFAQIAASPKAKAMTGFLWAFIGFLVELILVSLVQGARMRSMLQQYGLDNRFGGGAVATLVRVVCGAPVLALIVTLFFAIDVFIVQWLAKMFGGKGTADQLAYAMGAIVAPFAMVAGVLGLLSAIPFVGLCFTIVSFLLSLYIVVLNVMAVKGVNQFGWGPAIGSLFIPALVIGFLCGCLVVGSLALLGPAIRDALQQIQQGIQ